MSFDKRKKCFVWRYVMADTENRAKEIWSSTAYEPEQLCTIEEDK